MAPELHFVLVPYMAQGHMIPVVDFGRLLARRGVIVSIVTTPINAARFQPYIDHDRLSGLPISFLQLNYPSKEAGFPDGIENQDQLPPSISDMDFVVAARFLQHPLELLIQTLKPPPNCIVSDTILPFTMDVARKFNIPRISFLVFNCFSNVVMTNASEQLQNVKSEDESFVVPGLPHRIVISKRQTPAEVEDKFKDFLPQLYEADISSFGSVVNTFEEMEPEYVREFAKVRRKVWCAGPFSLCNTNSMDMAKRGKKAAVDDGICLKWLDSQVPNSVLYISFGSLWNPIPSQLIELAMALEASNRPFIWAIKGGNDTEELKRWVTVNEFEEKVKGRGFLIWGWAPQVLILSHSSIKGFLTHCGSNALLEGICMGLPLLTWPLMYEQFIAERLVVDVLKIGVSVGVKFPLNREKCESGDLVKKEDVKAAIDKFMDEGEESKERRRRAKELAEKAKGAVGEGGSSHLNVSLLIKDIMENQGSLNLEIG